MMQFSNLQRFKLDYLNIISLSNIFEHRESTRVQEWIRRESHILLL